MKTKLMLLTILITSVMNMNPAKAKRLEDGTLELIPVKNLKTEDESAMNYNNKHLKPLTKKPILTVENFSYKQLAKDRDISSIDARAEKELEKAFRKYQGGNVAVVLDGEVIAAPKLQRPKKRNISM